MSHIVKSTVQTDSEMILQQAADAFAFKKLTELIDKGDLKQPKLKSDRELGIETVGGGRYLRAFTKLSILDCYEKSVILNLAARLDFRGLDENGFFQDEVRYVTQEQLASDLSLSERKIRDVLTSLIKKKFIEKKNHYNFEKKRRSVNTYSITEYAFIECFNRLKDLNVSKYNLYLEELENAKRYFKEMFLTSQRIQSIHVKKLPAQYAGSDFTANDQPAQYAGCTGAVCRLYRHIVPILSSCTFPILNSPFMCVNENEMNQHTHIEKKEFQKKKTWKSDNKKENVIPTNFQWKLSEALKPVFKTKFIDNADCEEIITNVVQATNCTLKDFRNIIPDFSQYEPNIIFSKNKFEVESVSNDLIRWLTQKDQILNELEEKKKIEEQNQIKQAVLFEEEKRLEEEKKLKEEKLKLELIKVQKEKEEKEFEKLPEDFKEWFNTLPLFNKKMIKKEFRKFGLEKFQNNIIPSIQDFKYKTKKRSENYNFSLEAS